MQDAASRAAPKGPPDPTRRALFPVSPEEAEDWAVAASRNLDAPEMGSPPSSDEEDSSSGSSEVAIIKPLLFPFSLFCQHKYSVDETSSSHLGLPGNAVFLVFTK